MYPPILDSSNLLPLILLCSLALFFGGLHTLWIYMFVSRFNRRTKTGVKKPFNYQQRKSGLANLDKNLASAEN